ncbi:monocarboxylate transporter 12-like [Haemaphysalis longicornis]
MPSAMHLVDSRYAWLMAALSFWAQFWSVIIFRSSGVLLVGLVSDLRIERQEAAWPFEVCTAVNSIQALTAGILVKYWDTRILNIAAAVLASASAIGCFIWSTLTAYILFIGFGFAPQVIAKLSSSLHHRLNLSPFDLAGTGSGIVAPANVVVLCRYFEKYRASASGVSFSGAALSSMILPPVLGSLLQKYGLQGTMLIVAALVLNVVASGIALRSTHVYPRPLHAVPTRSDDISSRSSSRDNLAESKLPLSDIFSSEMLLESGLVMSVLARAPDEYRPEAQGFFRKPMFVLLMVTGIVYGYVFGTYLMTIVDHVSDKASSEQGAILISTMAMGDFCSRLGSGYITDRGFITREQLLIVNFALQGVCYILLTVLGSITSLVMVALIFGLNNGGTITSMPVLLADHLGDQHLPITYGMHRLTMGVSTLARPLLIGESGWPA